MRTTACGRLLPIWRGGWLTLLECPQSTHIAVVCKNDKSMINIIFRPYCNADYQACTDIFDANCSEFFAPNERQEYERFLEDVSEGYEVCEVDGRVLGAFGLLGDGKDEKRLNWILVDPQTQGIGILTMPFEPIVRPLRLICLK